MTDSISLRDYVESLFTNHKAEHAALESHRIELRDLLSRALDSVATALSEYKTSANEWRATLTDRDARFVDKVELRSSFDKLDTALNVLGLRVDELRETAFMQAGSKETGIDVRTVMFALAGFTFSAVTIGLGLIILYR